MTSQEKTRDEYTSAPEMTIGRDVAPFGLLLRVIVGLLLIVASVVELATRDDFGARAVLETAAYVLGFTLFYLVLHRFFGERVLGRLDPFVASAIVLLPMLIIDLPVFPDLLLVGVGIYIGVSLLITASIRYGGCELLALPTLLTGRRYTIYCSINMVDAAERPMRRSGDVAVRAAAVVALVIGSYFLIVRPILDAADVDDPVSRWWALLLLLPAAVLAARAVQSRHGEPQRAFALGLGAGALAAGAVIFAGLVMKDLLFAVVIVSGVLLAGYRALTTSRRDRVQGG